MSRRLPQFSPGTAQLIVSSAYSVASVIVVCVVLAFAPDFWIYTMLAAFMVQHILVFFATEHLCGPGVEQDDEPRCDFSPEWLAGAYVTLCDDWPDTLEKGVEVADMLHARIPDLDEATVGRVLMHLGEVLADHDDETHAVADILAAGLDLLEPEWHPLAGDLL